MIPSLGVNVRIVVESVNFVMIVYYISPIEVVKCLKLSMSTGSVIQSLVEMEAFTDDGFPQKVISVNASGFQCAEF